MRCCRVGDNEVCTVFFGNATADLHLCYLVLQCHGLVGIVLGHALHQNRELLHLFLLMLNLSCNFLLLLQDAVKPLLGTARHQAIRVRCPHIMYELCAISDHRLSCASADLSDKLSFCTSLSSSNTAHCSWAFCKPVSNASCCNFLCNNGA